MAASNQALLRAFANACETQFWICPKPDVPKGGWSVRTAGAIVKWFGSRPRRCASSVSSTVHLLDISLKYSTSSFSSDSGIWASKWVCGSEKVLR